MQEEASQVWREREMDRQKNGGGDDHTPKALLNGCLTGQLHNLLRYTERSICLALARADPHFKKSLPPLFNIPNMTLLKRDILAGATHTTAALGLYQILTTKLRNTNDGMPLTLYQEACCGLASGATAAFVWQPFLLAHSRVGLQNLTYVNWFNTLSHIVKNEGALNFWRGRGAGWFISTQAVTHMGLMASYNPSRNYLIESKGLPEWKAQICSGIISGFFTTVCYHPCECLKQIIDVVRKKYDGGEKNAYRNILHCICRYVTPYSGAQFYSRFLKCFHANALFCMMHWWIFEQVRKEEISWSKRDLTRFQK